MEKNKDRTVENGVEVRCIETPDGVLTVHIRTVTDEELEKLLHDHRREPKRVH